MKSQVYKIRNLSIPQGIQPHTIRLKPITALFLMVLIGIGLMFAGSSLMMLGFVMLIISLFCLSLLPDRVLMQFYPEFMLMYNQKDRSSCMMIDYSEIVQWRYDYGRAWDQFTVSLTDGSVETIEMYSRMPITRLMNLYAPGKEVRNVRRRNK